MASPLVQITFTKVPQLAPAARCVVRHVLSATLWFCASIGGGCAAPLVPVPSPPQGMGWHTESQGFISTTQSSSTSVATYGNLQVTTRSSSWSQSAEGLNTRRPLDPAAQPALLHQGDLIAVKNPSRRGAR